MMSKLQNFLHHFLLKCYVRYYGENFDKLSRAIQDLSKMKYLTFEFDVVFFFWQVVAVVLRTERLLLEDGAGLVGL